MCAMRTFEDLAAGDAATRGRFKDRLSSRLTDAFEMMLAKEVASASATMEQLLTTTSLDFTKVKNRIDLISRSFLPIIITAHTNLSVDDISWP